MSVQDRKGSRHWKKTTGSSWICFTDCMENGDWPTSGNLFIQIFFCSKNTLHISTTSDVYSNVHSTASGVSNKEGQAGQETRRRCIKQFWALGYLLQGGFLTGPSKIFLSIRLHSKSHQKSV